jgi:putative tryptophan/tyrosine transport system substrate-binding protein
LRRREFIAGLGAATAWPVVARAQRVLTEPRTPVIGVLWGRFGGTGFPMAAFRQGLADAGFIVDKNVTIELREADSLPPLTALAKDLVQRQANVVLTAPTLGVFRAAESATATIPIVFSYGGDPVKDGLVSSLASPGGNVTGITSLASELLGKRVGFLHQLIPDTTTIGFLSGPRGDVLSYNNVLQAANTLGIDVVVVRLDRDVGFERAFSMFAERRVGALVLDNFGNIGSYRSAPVISLAERFKIPTIYYSADAVRDGGLISYHAAFSERFRKAAVQYVGPILKGAKPADLPVQQPTKFELVINLKTAKALGLTVPETLLATADEVIQ